MRRASSWRSTTIVALPAIPGRHIELVAQVQRLAQHCLPLLFLGVTQEGLDSFLLFVADPPDLRADLLRVAAFLGLLDQRLELFLELLRDFAALLSFLIGDFQLLLALRA